MTQRHDRPASLLCGLAVAVLLAACGSAPDPTPLSTRLDDLPPLAGRKVVVMEPDIQLRVVYPGALMELNAEWTKLGREHVARSLLRRLKMARVEMVAAAQLDRERAKERDPRQTQLTKLHSAVARGILKTHYDSFSSSRKLPTKENSFDWSLGTEARFLRQKYDADYALFVAFHDNYPSATTAGPDTGFIAKLQRAMGEYRWGYASLVDLESGRVIWFAKREDESVGVRGRWQASDAVNELLKDFPG